MSINTSVTELLDSLNGFRSVVLAKEALKRAGYEVKAFHLTGSSVAALAYKTIRDIEIARLRGGEPSWPSVHMCVRDIDIKMVVRPCEGKSPAINTLVSPVVKAFTEKSTSLFAGRVIQHLYEIGDESCPLQLAIYQENEPLVQREGIFDAERLFVDLASFPYRLRANLNSYPLEGDRKTLIESEGVLSEDKAGSIKELQEIAEIPLIMEELRQAVLYCPYPSGALRDAAGRYLEKVSDGFRDPANIFPKLIKDSSIPLTVALENYFRKKCISKEQMRIIMLQLYFQHKIALWEETDPYAKPFGRWQLLLMSNTLTICRHAGAFVYRLEISFGSRCHYLFMPLSELTGLREDPSSEEGASLLTASFEPYSKTDLVESEQRALFSKIASKESILVFYLLNEKLGSFAFTDRHYFDLLESLARLSYLFTSVPERALGLLMKCLENSPKGLQLSASSLDALLTALQTVPEELMKKQLMRIAPLITQAIAHMKEGRSCSGVLYFIPRIAAKFLAQDKKPTRAIELLSHAKEIGVVCRTEVLGAVEAEKSLSNRANFLRKFADCPDLFSTHQVQKFLLDLASQPLIYAEFIDCFAEPGPAIEESLTKALLQDAPYEEATEKLWCHAFTHLSASSWSGLAAGPPFWVIGEKALMAYISRRPEAVSSEKIGAFVNAYLSSCAALDPLAFHAVAMQQMATLKCWPLTFFEVPSMGPLLQLYHQKYMKLELSIEWIAPLDMWMPFFARNRERAQDILHVFPMPAHLVICQLRIIVNNKEYADLLPLAAKHMPYAIAPKHLDEALAEKIGEGSASSAAVLHCAASIGTALQTRDVIKISIDAIAAKASYDDDDIKTIAHAYAKLMNIASLGEFQEVLALLKRVGLQCAVNSYLIETYGPALFYRWFDLLKTMMVASSLDVDLMLSETCALYQSDAVDSSYLESGILLFVELMTKYFSCPLLTTFLAIFSVTDAPSTEMRAQIGKIIKLIIRESDKIINRADYKELTHFISLLEDIDRLREAYADMLSFNDLSAYLKMVVKVARLDDIKVIWGGGDRLEMIETCISRAKSEKEKLELCELVLREVASCETLIDAQTFLAVMIILRDDKMVPFIDVDLLKLSHLNMARFYTSSADRHYAVSSIMELVAIADEKRAWLPDIPGRDPSIKKILLFTEAVEALIAPLFDCGYRDQELLSAMGMYIIRKAKRQKTIQKALLPVYREFFMHYFLDTRAIDLTDYRDEESCRGINLVNMYGFCKEDIDLLVKNAGLEVRDKEMIVELGRRLQKDFEQMCLAAKVPAETNIDLAIFKIFNFYDARIRRRSEIIRSTASAGAGSR